MPESAALIDATPISTEIVAVTVYPSQARVTRQGQLEVSQGPLTLLVKPLPAVLETQSIQAFAKGTAVVSLQKPILIPLAADAERDETIQTLSDRVHQGEENFRQCKDILSSLNHQQTFLESLAEKTAQTFAEGLAQQSANLSQVAEFTDFFETTYQRNAAAIATHERRKHDLDLQLQQARQDLQQFQSRHSQPKYQILLPLTVHQAGTLVLSLAYNVTQAQWSPAYDVRLENEQSALQFNCIAEIQQQTGEHWEQVNLDVSTAAPERTPEIPQVNLWQLPAAKPASSQSATESKRDIKSRSRVLDETYRMLGALPGSEIPPQQEEDILGDGMLQPANAIIGFQAPHPVAIQSNGQPHRVAVGQLHLESRFTYVALPQRSSAPYLCAALTNPRNKWPLLPGTAYLFRDGGYIGQEKFDYVAPGESFQLSLGLDENVIVQRELVPQKDLPDSADRDIRAFRLTVQNPFDRPIDVTVIEQMPVARSEEVSVQLLSAEPSTEIDQQGQCQWLLKLDAQRSQHIFYQFEVQNARTAKKKAPHPLMALEEDS